MNLAVILLITGVLLMSYNQNNPRPISNSNHFILSNYSPKKRITINFPLDSPYTKQEFKDECDINILMSQYIRSGQIPNLNEAPAQYLDVSASADFQQAMEFVAGAQTLFQEMPADIRARFRNDPREFLDFCGQEKNRPEMAEMGLLRPVNEWVQAPVAPVSQSDTILSDKQIDK